ncbi:amidohydrolase [soil metagenome]
MKVPVAAIQYNPTMFAHEENIVALEALTIEAAQSGAKLIVHPEMGTTGYCWQNREEIAPYVETIPGPTTDRFATIAREQDCWIVVGLAEVVPETRVYYNSVALIGPDGVAGVYRKTHSYIAEPAWAKDGDLGMPVFDTPLGKIGMLICMDIVYFETARLEALQGADVICLPVNWAGETSPAGSWISRAIENGVSVIVANRSDVERGTTFCGQSCVIGPDGMVQSVLASGEGIVYGEIESAAPIREALLAGRRPDLYSALTRNSHLWNPEKFNARYGIAPLPAGKTSKIAAAQFTPVAGDIEGNLAIMTELATAALGADLLVFPELALTGAVDGRVDLDSLADICATFGIDSLRAMANNAGTTIVAGIVEHDEHGRFFNSAAAVDSSGVLAIARKAHLTESDRVWATCGDRPFTVVDLALGRLGVLIGHDLACPESARTLAIEAADVIAVPAMMTWPAPTGGEPGAENFVLGRQQARENKVYLALANGAGVASTSGVFGPDPEDHPDDEMLIRHGDRAVAALGIDTSSPDPRFPTNPIRRKDTLRMRQPYWYEALQRC